MSKANSEIITGKSGIAQVTDGLFALEHEFHSVKNLSHAIFMMAGSNMIDKEPAAALQSLAEMIIQKMELLCSERDRLWNLAKADGVR